MTLILLRRYVVSRYFTKFSYGLLEHPPSFPLSEHPYRKGSSVFSEKSFNFPQNLLRSGARGEKYKVVAVSELSVRTVKVEKLLKIPHFIPFNQFVRGHWTASMFAKLFHGFSRRAKKVFFSTKYTLSPGYSEPRKPLVIKGFTLKQRFRVCSEFSRKELNVPRKIRIAPIRKETRVEWRRYLGPSNSGKARV